MRDEMVCATLADVKIMTRRPVKPQPPSGARVRTDPNMAGIVDRLAWSTINPDAEIGDDDAGETGLIYCPYGKPGDRLWVREAWTADFGTTFSDNIDAWWHQMPKSLRTERAVQMMYYRADSSTYHAHRPGELVTDEFRRSDWTPSEEDLEGIRWVPGIHMYRWASRITLEVTSVRVERVQQITPEDAIAEGLSQGLLKWRISPIDAYERLWDSIHGDKPLYSWDANPWVWVIGFKRLQVAR